MRAGTEFQGTQSTQGSAVTEKERVMDWVRFYKQSPLKYEMNALIACYESDGEQILGSVLKELGLLQSADLIKDAANKSK